MPTPPAVPPRAVGLRPGDLVRTVFTKYDGSPHWEFDMVVVGQDEHGIWLGGSPGDVFARPGRVLVASVYSVTLIPWTGWYVATFNQPGGTMRSQIYIDLSSEPDWVTGDDVAKDGDAATVYAVDLDLDVVRRFTGEEFIDDEDEFLTHQLAYAYPPDVIDVVRRTADELLVAVRERREPYGSVGTAWLAVCEEMLRPTPE